jgi:hypothetical protein
MRGSACLLLTQHHTVVSQVREEVMLVVESVYAREDKLMGFDLLGAFIVFNL